MRTGHLSVCQKQLQLARFLAGNVRKNKASAHHETGMGVQTATRRCHLRKTPKFKHGKQGEANPQENQSGDLGSFYDLFSQTPI